MNVTPNETILSTSSSRPVTTYDCKVSLLLRTTRISISFWKIIVKIFSVHPISTKVSIYPNPVNRSAHLILFHLRRFGISIESEIIFVFIIFVWVARLSFRSLTSSPSVDWVIKGNRFLLYEVNSVFSDFFWYKRTVVAFFVSCRQMSALSSDFSVKFVESMICESMMDVTDIEYLSLTIEDLDNWAEWSLTAWRLRLLMMRCKDCVSYKDSLCIKKIFVNRDTVYIYLLTRRRSQLSLKNFANVPIRSRWHQFYVEPEVESVDGEEERERVDTSRILRVGHQSMSDPTIAQREKHEEEFRKAVQQDYGLATLNFQIIDACKNICQRDAVYKWENVHETYIQERRVIFYIDFTARGSEFQQEIKMKINGA